MENALHLYLKIISILVLLRQVLRRTIVTLGNRLFGLYNLCRGTWTLH